MSTYRPPDRLRPVIGLSRLFGLTFAVIAPATSVFLTYGAAYARAGTGVFLSYIIAAVVNVAIMFSYAEVGSRYPEAGGDYSLAARALGPSVGTIYTLLFALKGIMVPAVLALTQAAYLALLWPTLSLVPVALAILAIYIAIAFMDIGASSRVVTFMVLIEAGVFALFVAATLASGHQPLAVLIHPQRGEAPHATYPPLASLWAAAIPALYGLNGAQACLYYSEETNAGPRAFGTTVLTATLITICVELLGVLAATLALPSLGLPMHGVVPLLPMLHEGPLGPGGTRVLVLGIFIALLDTGIATTMSYGRIYFAIARDGQWPGPFNRWCLRLSARRIPYGAILLIGATNLLVILIAGSAFLIVLTGSVLLLLYLGVALAGMVTRIRTGPPPYTMPLWPIPPVVAVVGLLVLALQIGPRELFILSGLLLVGAAAAWGRAHRASR